MKIRIINHWEKEHRYILVAENPLLFSKIYVESATYFSSSIWKKLDYQTSLEVTNDKQTLENYLWNLMDEKYSNLGFFGYEEGKGFPSQLLEEERSFFLKMLHKKCQKYVCFQHLVGDLYFLDDTVLEFASLFESLKKRRLEDTYHFAEQAIESDPVKMFCLSVGQNEGEKRSAIELVVDGGSFQRKFHYHIHSELMDSELDMISRILGTLFQKYGAIDHVQTVNQRLNLYTTEGFPVCLEGIQHCPDRIEKILQMKF